MFKETTLLQASLAGDKNAFEKLVEKYQAIVCAITFSGTGRVDVSEELAQETFLNAWENLHQLRDLKGFRSWLYSIARNTLRNYRRRKEPASVDANLVEQTTEDTQDPPEILIRQEEHIMLEQAIMRLPEKYREPLILFCRQQQSIREAATALGLSEATFRTRLHRARNLLREEIAERLEHVLKQTGPRKDFTKAVMVAIGSIPVALSATADAALTATSGQSAVTGGISAVFAGAGMKIAAVTAVVAVSALTYTYWNKDRTPALRPDDTPAIGAESSMPPLQKPTDIPQGLAEENPFQQAAAPVPSREEGDQEQPHPDQQAAGIEEPIDTPEPGLPETIITGTVLDRNTLRPVSGARVGFRPTETVLTDSDGRFRLSYEESQEEAFICAMAPGHAFEQIAMRVNIGGRQDILFKVQPGLTLVGTVVDPNHNPIEDVKVSVHNLRLVSQEATTNDQGQFKIDGLNPEDAFAHVSAEHPDYVPDSSATVKMGPLGEEMLTEIVLTPRPPGAVLSGQVANAQSEPVAQATMGWMHTPIKATTDHEGRYALKNSGAESPSLYVTHPQYPVFVTDVTLPPETKETKLDVQLANPQVLSGRIVDDLGNPVSDADIGIESYRGKSIWGWAGIFHCDSEGRFTIPNAPSQEDYRLLVLGDGIHRTSHTVSASQDECLITVSRSGRVYGRVIDGETGDPIPCFRVRIEGSGTGLPARWTLDGYTFTSEEGQFDTGRLELTDGKQLSLAVYTEGYDPLTLDSVPVQPISENPERTVFRLQRNERRSTLYAGRVVDTEGRGIGGAKVGFRPEHRTDNRRGFSRVLTDASGAYMISSIDPHEQIAYVRASGYAPISCRMSELLLEAGGAFTDVVLDPAATVSGYAWDELGQAIANTGIISTSAARSMEELEFMESFQLLWPQTQTDEHGYYQLTGLPIGEVHVQVLFEDHRRMAPKTVTVHPGDSLALNFGEQSGFVISGVVLDGEELLEDVEVQLKATDKALKSHGSRTDALGQFRFIHVPGGEYVFATLIRQKAADEQARDPNDTSHILYEAMDIQGDLDLTVDYRTRSIDKSYPIP